MGKIYTALGLMSGTSMDGVDVSIIKSDGHSQFNNIFDKYYEFDEKLHKKLIKCRNQISTKDDLVTFSDDLKALEREITIFHSKIVIDILSDYKEEIDLVGFHGQTIFHKSKEKISRQLGDGNLLSQLIKKKVVYDFRQADLKDGGQGAPLTPIFHNLLINNIYKKYKIEFPLNVLNIGGISNVTKTTKETDLSNAIIEARDIGPGNFLIDEWIRKNSNKKFDKEGQIGKSGKINQLILNQAIDNFNINHLDESIDVKDFDISFLKGLSLADGCATITNFTAYLIAEGIKFFDKENRKDFSRYLICGGGRKNSFLIENIQKYLKDFSNINLEAIDLYNIDGDYVESQAFGYLAIRSYLKLPISFPNTTGCKKPCQGGVIVKNY
tara:strand:+ start:754 stop:1902 length:1149 start_codon:yes stop_codon:yes gene_type:complete